MNWHYAAEGQQVGPVTDDQLLQLFQAGQINADTLVWHEGLPDWITYHQASRDLVPSPSFQPSAQLPPLAGPLNENEVLCAECGKPFPVGETIRIGKASVCAACKPIFLQKLSEGARINTGELEYARVLTRFAAMIIDGLILFAVNMATNTVLGLFFGLAAGHSSQNPAVPAAFLGLQLILMAVNLAVGVSYEGFMIGKYGATLGKMALKIKVVTADGGKVSYARAFGRYFAKMLSGIACLIGYIMALFDDQKRALHDHICNTRVVMK